jgi:2-polyprenyl-3-methyl-5-hydroxy-6-metoxy-1,4-benzoquinol methylase
LLDRILPGAPVLDVGCWSGFAGRYLAESHRVEVDGIEPDPVMAKEAAQRYRQVINSSIEQALPRLHETHQGHYGTVLLLDVLEHLAWPDKVLGALGRLVRPGGHILVSLPNVAHWTVRRDLLLGRWRYARSGLLDETHLRFFTLASAQELLQSSGWEIVWSDVEVDQPPLVRLGDRSLRLLSRWRTVFGVQLLFDARLPAAHQPSTSR